MTEKDDIFRRFGGSHTALSSYQATKGLFGHEIASLQRRHGSIESGASMRSIKFRVRSIKFCVRTSFAFDGLAHSIPGACREN